MSTRSLVSSLTAVLAIASLACARGPGDPSGYGTVNSEPTVSERDLIEPSARTGNLPAIVTAGAEVWTMDLDVSNELPATRIHRSLDQHAEYVLTLFVCTRTYAVHAVFDFAESGNERFETVEGIGQRTSEVEVPNTLGEHVCVFEWKDNHQLSFLPVDDAPGLSITFKTDALALALGTRLAGICDP